MFYLEKMFVAADDSSTADAIDALRKQLAGRDNSTPDAYINIPVSYYKLLSTDWKAFVPSKLLSNLSYFGPIYGIIREDSGEIYIRFKRI